MNHDVNSMGDFLNCKKSGCCWSATWSLGHICDHCKLNHCICPCPLTKDWIENNKWEITGRKIAEIIQHNLNDEFFLISKEEENKDDPHSVWGTPTNKQKWERIGELEALQRLITLVKVNHEEILRNKINAEYFCGKCRNLKPICRCKKSGKKN